MNMLIYEQLIGEVDWKVAAVFVASFLGMLALRFTFDILRHCYKKVKRQK